jgi:hypothetical protein
MTAMRFLAIIVITFAAMEFAAAETKKTPPPANVGRANFDVFTTSKGIDTATTNVTRTKGNGSSPVGNSGKSGGKR